MTAPLPPYGTAHLCAKCGCPDISDSYRAGHPHLVWHGGDLEEIATHGPTGGECLLRTCRDCGWAWLEACADAELVTEIDTPTGGKLEFEHPVTRACAQDYAERLTRGMPNALLPSGAGTQGTGRDGTP